VIFLIGDFTSMIAILGPQHHAPPLTREQIEPTPDYFEQAAGAGSHAHRDPLQLRVVYAAGADGMIRLASHYTLARLLSATTSASATARAADCIHEILYL